MEIITSLSLYLPSNIKHEIKLEKRKKKRTMIYVVDPIWATSMTPWERLHLPLFKK